MTCVVAGCGKKGPPLPPLVKLPAAPTPFSVARRGDTVDVEFTVPATNTDNTRPANITRVDVYALTGPAAVTDADLIQRGVRVGSVEVKTPRDPNLTTEADEPEDESFEPPEGNGLDQGAVAHLTETLAGPSFAGSSAASAAGDAPGPLLSPSAASTQVRTYYGVGVARNGRKGRPSARAMIPLGSPPAAPAAPKVENDENALTVSWMGGEETQPKPHSPPEPGLLPATPFGPTQATTAYVVYETPDTKLTPTPIAATRFTDPHLVWGVQRCYVVRAVRTIDKLAVESAASPPACKTPVDTFPPAAPKDLKSVGTEGAISLIWEANTEKDLDGYLVLRAVASAGPQAVLRPITPAPIHDTTFRDSVEPGVRYVYAVQAVDKAGNLSESSNPVEETAR